MHQAMAGALHRCLVLDARDLFLGSVFVIVMHYVYAIIMHVSERRERDNGAMLQAIAW